ncbi:shikimate dehydrogenase [Chryseomicrobium sp. FSL W7-1435]|uniref:shikimate dehydrogenase n=1 Tax=Chryseomicrobium sp. FSL W7-1435 TaxID=2921704 RepID=UPI00315A70E8
MKKWFAVLGNPIHHSISPKMHEQWFRTHQLDASYVPILVEPSHLKESVDSLALLGCSGFNVTVPFKEAILPFLDVLDESALAAGAVNTVVRDQEKWIGYNTDGLGLLASIPQLTPETRVLIIGAGGAAKGILAALHQRNVQNITITNRSINKMDLLAKQYSTSVLDLTKVNENLSQFEVVIQTTSVGMDSTETPVELTNWNSEMTAVDIIYSPPETLFLQQAKAQGAATMNGLAMLIGQGALAFELWTGIKPDQQEIRETIFRQKGETHVNK